MNDEKYKLDDDVLYMLRIMAMENNIVPAPADGNNITCRDQLIAYLNGKTEDSQYFVELSRAIGYEDDGRVKKRVPLKINRVWDLLRYEVGKVCVLRIENVKEVADTTGYILDRDSARYFVAQIFGFYNFREFLGAALKKGFKLPPSDRLITVEEQDFIARTLGYKKWLDISKRENNTARKVSDTLLKRAYGRTSSKSVIGLRKLDYLADFIAEKNWNELQTTKEEVMSEMESKYFSRGSGQIYVGRPRKENPRVIYVSYLKEGDKVKLSFLNGKKMTLGLVEKCTFKVLETQSNYVKVGYTLTAYEIRLNNILRSNEVWDENGNMLNSGYSSDIIKEIHFEGLTK